MNAGLAGRAIAPGKAGVFTLTTVLTLAAIFLSPYTTWRIVPSLLFTISDALFCLSLVLIFGARRPGIEPFGDLTPLWLGALGVMLLGLLVGSAINGDLLRWLIVAAQYSFAYGILPLAFGLWRRTDAITACVTLVAGVVAMEAVGIVVYISVDGDYERAQAFGTEFITGAHRLGGFMADANWNGAISAMAVPFVLFLITVGRQSAIVGFGALGILGGGVILSGSFTGFAAAAASVLIFFMVCRRTRAFKVALSIAIAGTVALASGALLPVAFQHRVAQALEHQDLEEAGTYAGRMELIREAWKLVEHTPVVGIGVDQFRAVSVDEAPVHNMYLLVWAEGGVLALTGWLILALTPILASVRAMRRDSAAAALGLAVAAVFIIFSMAAPHMYSRSWVVPLLIPMAMLSRRPSRADADREA